MPVCLPPNSPPNSARHTWGKLLNTAPIWPSRRSTSTALAIPRLAFSRTASQNPSIIAAVTFDVIEPDVATANTSHSDLWLTGAVQVIFMSYYIPLPGLNDAGLGKVWDGLDVVSRIVTQDGAFHMAAPMEFRFVKGGDTAMSATFAENPQNTWFGNLDLIGFVKKEQKPSDYSPKLLQFFADVEREWVKMGGFPHNGKMYGFYDPTAAAGTHRPHSTRTSWPTFAGAAARASPPSPPTARASIPKAFSTTNSCSRCWSRSARRATTAIVAGALSQRSGTRRSQWRLR